MRTGLATSVTEPVCLSSLDARARRQITAWNPRPTVKVAPLYSATILQSRILSPIEAPQRLAWRMAELRIAFPGFERKRKPVPPPRGNV